MTPERWRRIKELFDAALAFGPDERGAFVERACQADSELATEVKSLLAEHRDDGFLEGPPSVQAKLSFLEPGDLGLKSCPACSTCYGDGRLSCPDDGESLVAELPGSPLIDATYLIDRRLGHGGMGVVYRARHKGLDRFVALKLIRPEASSNAEFLARFRVEAKALGRLRHEGIVAVTDSGVDPRDGGLPYLVMEYLEGISLHEHVRRAGATSIDESLPILDGVARALDFAHEHGVLHRDLKDANVFLCPTPSGPPVTKILDFGLARLLGSAETSLEVGSLPRLPAPEVNLLATDGRSPTVTLGRMIEPPAGDHSPPGPGRITAPGQIGCTFEYAAPEVLRREDATVSSDLYSFAVMAYRILVGRLPFDGKIGEVVQGHLHGAPPRPSSVCPSLPPEMDAPLLGALAKDASARPRCAMDLVESLRSAAREARRRKFRSRELPRRFVLGVVGGGILTALALSASVGGPLHRLELWAIDARFALQPIRPPDPRLLLVLLDDASLSADESPLSQRGDEFGRRLDAVFDVGARAVALDILAPREWGRSEAFANLVLRHADQLTLAAAAGPASDALGPESVANLTAVALGAERVAAVFGLVNVQEDPDGIVRRSRLHYVDRDGTRRWTLAARAAATLAGPRILESHESSLVWVQHAVDWQRIPRVSWKDLEGRAKSEPQLFRGKLVLVGADFAGSGDLDHRIPSRPSSPAVVPGVVLHALMASSILDQGLRYREVSRTPTVLVLWLALSLVLGGTLVVPRPAWLAPGIALLTGLHVLLAVLVFRSGNVVPVVAPLVGAASALAVGLALRAVLPQHPG